MTDFQHLPIVEVVWIDAVADVEHEADLNDKAQVRDFGGLVVCKDVGYLVRRNRKEVVLAVGFVDKTVVRHSNTIPSPWIISITYLTKGSMLYERRPQPSKGPTNESAPSESR